MLYEVITGFVGRTQIGGGPEGLKEILTVNFHLTKQSGFHENDGPGNT